MKKIILTVAGSMFIALATVNAQRSDTPAKTKTKQESSNEYRKSTEPKKETGPQGRQSEWNDKDAESLNKGDLPSGLVKTLESAEYKGWESATIYRNNVSTDYMLVIQDNGEVKTFYFDKEGQARRNDNSGMAGHYGSRYRDNRENSNISNNQDQGISAQWNTQDRVLVRSAEVPASLKMTLGSPQYKGWENSSIYRHRTSNDYMIEIKDGASSKSYYFDKDGKAKQYGANTSDQMNDQSSSYKKDQKNTDKTTTSSNVGQTTTSGAIGTSQGGDESDAAGEDDKNYTLNRASTQSDTGTQWQSTDQEKPSVAWRTEDRVMITTSEIPSSLRVTLADDKYKGWEKSTIYRNRATNDYMVEIRDGSNAKMYYFDKEGKVMTSGKMDGSSYQNDQKTNDTRDSEKKQVASGYSSTEEKATPVSDDGGSLYEWKSEDKIMITSSEIPVSLQTTLRDPKYKGWEKSTIYRNKTTNEYLIEIMDGTQNKMYYFDKTGKAIEIEMED